MRYWNSATSSPVDQGTIPASRLLLCVALAAAVGSFGAWGCETHDGPGPQPGDPESPSLAIGSVKTRTPRT